MNLLALETSGRRGGLALAMIESGRCTVTTSTLLPASPRAAQTLLPTIRDLLARQQWRPADVDAIAVSVGPGSFTGLRIGATVAKTLAFVTGAKLVAVPTLAALAHGREASRRPVWSVIDAQRDELFAARFTADPTGLGDDAPCRVLAIEDWLSLLQLGEAVATPALAKLAPRLPSFVEAISDIDDGPPPSAIAALAAAMLAAGRTVDPLQLVPDYGRKSAAEEKAAR